MTLLGGLGFEGLTLVELNSLDSFSVAGRSGGMLMSLLQIQSAEAIR